MEPDPSMGRTRLGKLMNAPSPSWLVSRGADPQTINELVLEAGPLPRSYLECLRRGNGGEVGLRVSPLNLCLDPAEAALDYWRSGTYTTQEVFVFGSSGGGDLFAFDLRTPGEWPVVCYDPIDPEGSMERVASSFELLLELCEGA